MKSVKKKGASSILHLDPNVVARLSGTEELISALSDKEMAVIDNYAVMLKEGTDMSAEESYATALDSYLRGLQEARKVSPFSPMVGHKVSPFSPIVDEQPEGGASACASPAAKASVLMAPNTPSSATRRVMDRDLVDKYMFLIMRESGVDEGTAYSTSLDAFLADKTTSAPTWGTCYKTHTCLSTHCPIVTPLCRLCACRHPSPCSSPRPRRARASPVDARCRL